MTIMGNVPTGALHVDRDHMAKLMPRQGGWRDNAFSCAGGQAWFRIGAIAPGIAATHSRCSLRSDFHSRVEHEGETGILGFGMSGASLFGIDGEGPRHLVGPGEVWLFRVNDLAMERRTPAQDGAGMLAVKFDASRLYGLFDGSSANLGSGTRAVRLGRHDASDCGIGALLSNPLVSPLDRLQAESQALGLLAHWLAPLPALPDDHGVLARDERRGVARVIDMLASDLCSPPSLDELAVQAGMSHTRLNRCFRKAYGKTVFHWLRDYRLDVACRHLESGRHSVTEIAFLCGFSSSSHFASAFRQRFGSQPCAFRRQRG